jgi:hypothetical protein
MRCSECNTQISPEGAPYCWNCGAPQHSSEICAQCHVYIRPQNAAFCWRCETPQHNGNKWETCEVVYEFERYANPWPQGQGSFKARGTWDGQPITFAESSFKWSKEPFWQEPEPKEDEIVVQEAIQQLTTQLKNSGWELLGDGDRWYNLKFRRRSL